MSDALSLQERAALLSEAIKACEGFNAILDKIRLIPVGHPGGDTTTIRDENRRLQEELVEKMNAAAERRNEIVSPFALLTDDIVGRIFEMVTELVDHPTRYYIHGVERWRIPVTLSHVCRRWRTVALDLPRLWVSVILGHPQWVPSARAVSTTPVFRTADVGLRTDLLERQVTFINRARSVPLQASFALAPSTKVTSQVWQDKLLVLCNHRISSLELHVEDNPESGKKMLSCITLLSPSLRELVLAPMSGLIGLDDSSWIGVLHTFFVTEFPALHSLAMRFFPLPPDIHDAKALKNCKALTIHTVIPAALHMNAILSLLRVAPELRELSLTLVSRSRHRNADSVEPVKPVTLADRVCLARLAMLKVSLDHTFNFILPFLEAPVLEQLVLDMPNTSQIGPMGYTFTNAEWLQHLAYITEFLGTTRSLDRLSLGRIPFVLLSGVLDATPTITMLSLTPLSSQEAEYTSVLDLLIAGSTRENNPVCPNLTGLVLQYTPSRGCIGLLTDFIIRRRSSETRVSPIRRVELPKVQGPRNATLPGQQSHVRDCYQAAEDLAELVDELCVGGYKFDVTTRDWKLGSDERSILAALVSDRFY